MVNPVETQIEGIVGPESTKPLVLLSGSTLILTIGTILIDGDSVFTTVIYPDNFTKTHQSPDMADLMSKIAKTLRGRYGVQSFSILEMPREITEDENIVLNEVDYGA